MLFTEILIIIDTYFKLILNSWPAVLLILSLFILIRHRKAIDDRIKNIKSIGPKGVNMFPPNSEVIHIPNSELSKNIEASKPKKETTEKNIALVDWRIDSSLPGTVTFNFLRDWKVWFLIINKEPKQYKAYIKTKFITEGHEEEVSEGYFGGTRAWKLNAFSGIQAPGLGIPERIKEAANQRKNIKIEINCTVKNGDDEFIEKKLPSVYVYEYEKNYWYLEP